MKIKIEDMGKIIPPPPLWNNKNSLNKWGKRFENDNYCWNTKYTLFTQSHLLINIVCFPASFGSDFCTSSQIYREKGFIEKAVGNIHTQWGNCDIHALWKKSFMNETKWNNIWALVTKITAKLWWGS
jgi:hypothetical protein